ncbi:MAG: tripartite tricarboxylate transporter substrate binding protein [Betaproteobacteria bacterium]|nr:tripartite tricarboxylate transporter substrate binding protein [Betaproteobacteria bacterium]
MKRMTVITGFALAMVAASTGMAQQAAYPSKPSRMVIPFGPGGGNDIVARVLSAKLSDSFGQPVIVDNKPGAQGIIAAEAVKTAVPDGYTMLMGPSGVMSANVATHDKLPYAPLKDFVPVLMIGSFPLILVVNVNHPARTVQELVAYAKANPAKVNYGSTTALFQLTSELFNQKTSTNFVHIPYKSSGEFVNAVLSGEITIAFSDPPPAAAHLKSGRLRALGVTAATRHPSWPDVPTMAEAGVPDMAFSVWMGLFVPAGTPAAAMSRLRDDVTRILAMTDVRERFAGLGVDPSGMGTEAFTKIIADDIARWTAVAKTGNIKAQ